MFGGYISFCSGFATGSASRAVQPHRGLTGDKGASLIGLLAPGGPGVRWGRSGTRACA